MWKTPEKKHFDDEYYVDSLVLNYTLRFKGERLSKIKNITLKANQKTPGNRLLNSLKPIILNFFSFKGYKPVQKLTCQTPNLCRLYAPAEVRCTHLFNSSGFNNYF